MHVVVCLKQILDPETSPKDFKIDAAARRPVQGSARLVLDSYAENALEVALQFKEQQPGTRVTALSVGEKAADEVLRRAVALTADAGVRVRIGFTRTRGPMRAAPTGTKGWRCRLPLRWAR